MNSWLIITGSLAAVMGLAWILAYVEAIRLGVRQRTYAIPCIPILLNITWEITYVFTLPINSDTIVYITINAAWFLLDIGILATFLLYGRRSLRISSRLLFIAWTVAILLLSTAVQLAFLWEFGSISGARYSAFLSNLVMSVAFLAMFAARGGGRAGQSVLLAVAKAIGSFSATFLFGIVLQDLFLTIIGIATAAFDVAYIVALMRSRPGLMPPLILQKVDTIDSPASKDPAQPLENERPK